MAVSRFIPPGMGWQRDLPDPRDYTPQHPLVRALLEDLPVQDRDLPPQVDLRHDDEGFVLSPPENQGSVNSSSAFASLALIEYFECKTLGRTFEGSALFLYQMARKVEGVSGNAPVGLRTALKALIRYGTPPEEMWPYADSQLAVEPTDICLAGYAGETQGITYLRLNHCSGDAGPDMLNTARSFLAAGFPIAFGIPVPRGLTQCPDIPYRPTFESYRGGQALVALGYNDIHQGARAGAILVRSSWGLQWGDSGYGHLPYAYLRTGLATDFWTILHPRWTASRELYRPAVAASP